MCRQRFSLRAADALALLLTMACVSAMPARAGVDSWTPFGPGEGRMTSVAASSRGDVFAIAPFGDLAEVWQLPAGTATWRWRNSGLGRPLVTALAVHPTQPDSLWAATGGPSAAIFRSSDGGAAWVRVADAPADFPIGKLWVVPTRTSVALLAQIGGVGPPLLRRSGDGGVTWSELPGLFGPVAAAADQTGVVYAAAGSPGLDPGLARSTDGGLTFQRARIGLHHNDSIHALHVTRGRQPLVFASTGGGLFRSSNGVRFQLVGFSTTSGPPALASDPRHPRRIYAADAQGFWTSTNGGGPGSFRLTAGVYPVGIVPAPTAMVFAAMGPVMLGGGDLFDARFRRIAEGGIESFGVSEVRVSPATASDVAVREYLQCLPQCDLRTFLSRDAGATFVRRGIQVLPRFFAEARDFAFDPATPQRSLELSAGVLLFDPTGLHMLTPTVVNTPPTAVEIAAAGALLVGAGGGVLVSRDDGHSWATTLGNPAPFSPTTVADLRADVGAPDRVLALVIQLATADPPAPAKLLAFRSLDAGEHWSAVLPATAALLDVEPVAGSPTSLFALFAVAGGSELRRSDDGGATSVPVHTFTTAEAVSDVAVDAVAPNVLYAAGAAGLLRSRDGGASWESTPGTLDAWGPYRQRLQRLWVHPTERGHVFAAPVDGGLFDNRLGD